MKQFGNVGERMEVFFEIDPGGRGKASQIYRLIVQRIEIDSFLSDQGATTS